MDHWTVPHNTRNTDVDGLSRTDGTIVVSN
jgi:hypothetical protein